MGVLGVCSIRPSSPRPFWVIANTKRDIRNPCSAATRTSHTCLYSRTTRLRQCPLPYVEASLQRNSKSLFVPSSSAPHVERCAVLCCAVVRARHRHPPPCLCSFTTQVLSHQTRLTRLPPTQSAVCLCSLALIRAFHTLPLSSMPRANTPPSPRIRVVSPVVRSLQLCTQACLTSGFRHISQRARVNNQTPKSILSL
jgi:hypothetical protein